MDQAKYEELREAIAAGKTVQHDGRTAGSIEELNWMAGLYPDAAIDTRGPDPATAKTEVEELRARVAELEAENAALRAEAEASLPAQDVDLTKMTVEQLLEFAKEREIDLPSGLRKAELVDAISEALAKAELVDAISEALAKAEQE